MKLEGMFIVSLFDDREYEAHPSGSWSIEAGCAAFAWTAKDGLPDSVPERLAHLRNGGGWFIPLEGRATLKAESFTGKTGVEGTVMAWAGRHVLVDGYAWGSGVYKAGGRVGFNTHTFQVMSTHQDTFYSGTIKELKGLPANHDMLERLRLWLSEKESRADSSLPEE